MIKKLFSADSKPGAFFRRIDWTAFWSATLVSFLVYFFTLGPSTGLEDSGELATAADHLGVPHPPGYPFWTMCSWVFCRVFSWVSYMGHPTPAWAVALFSAVAGAFAAGCTAMLICRSGSDMLDSMDSGAADAQQRVPPEGIAQRHALMGFAGGLGGALVFAFSPVEWSQSTIVEIYSLNALFLMAVFLLSYRWMRKPSDKILWLTAFVFGLGLTNYQVLLMAALPLVLIILLKDIRLFRDLLLILIPIGLTVQVLKVGSMNRASAMMGAEVINKFEPILLAESCPKGVLLWIAFGLVAAAPVLGMILSAITKKRQVALYGALGLGLAGVILIALANTVFADTPVEVESLQQFVKHLKRGDFPCTWEWTKYPDFAPLIQPATYTWIALFLAASCVLSLGAVFAPREARLCDHRVWTWLVGAGCCAIAACMIAGSIPAADNAGYSGEAFSWTYNTICLVVGLALLLVLALLTPRQRGLAFALPVAAVQIAVFILLYKGAMNGLTHPTTWWFYWPCIWNFVMLGLAIVALPNGRSIGLAMLFAELGVSFYAYMPIVSTCRKQLPMNWGYPCTWEGFKHAIMRGQYEAIKMPPIFSYEGFNNFLEQIGHYFQDLRRQFTLVACALALLPFAAWSFALRLKKRARPLVAKAVLGSSVLYVVTAALVIIYWASSKGEIPHRIDKWLLASLAGLAAVGTYLILRRQASLLFGAALPKSRLGNVICMCLFGGLALFSAFILVLSLMGKGFAGGINFVSFSSVTSEMIAKGVAVKPSTKVLYAFNVSAAILLAVSAIEFTIQLLAIIRYSFKSNVNPDIDDISQKWLIAVGSCFAVMSILLVALANVKGDIQDGFIQKVKFISSHAMFSIWIGYGLVIGLVVAYRLVNLIRWRWSRHVVFGALCACAACVALIPIYENYKNDRLVFEMGAAEQNGHTFGWQFGNYQLRGAKAIREELSPDEEPLPNPLWPEEMGTNAVFFGGTDPGRFIPTYMIYSANVRPDVKLITQNALADDTYMSVERDLYGDEIWIPSKNDSAEAFNIYVSEVQSGKRKANGDIQISNGRVQVTGALGVMEINGILTRMMFDHERLRRAFYVEESYVIPWMYDYLTPHGLIMKLNSDSNSINDAIVRNDMEFWDWYTRRLLRDPAFRRDFAAQKSFSKLRTAIAGLYASIIRKTQVERHKTRNELLVTQNEFRRNPNGQKNRELELKFQELYQEFARLNQVVQKYSSLAASAFREAVALYPASPEASFRYIQEVLLNNDKWDATLDILSYVDRVDPNNRRIKDEDEDNEKTKGILSHVRAMKDAPDTLNTILRKYWKQDSPPPDVTLAPFPDDVRKQLSSDELDRLAEARLDYAESCLYFGNLNHAFQSLAFLKNNPARDKTFDRLWRATKVMHALYKYGKVPQWGIECADLAAEALNSTTDESCPFKVQDMAVNIFFDTALQLCKIKSEELKAIDQKRQCIKAIQNATEFLDKKKPSKQEKDEKGMDGEKFFAALRYLFILERFKDDSEKENKELEDLKGNIVDKVLAVATPAQILTMANGILDASSNVNGGRQDACAKYVGQKLLDPLMGRKDTTYGDMKHLSEYYEKCRQWTDDLTLTKDFAEKSIYCFSEFAKAVSDKDCFLELAKMYDAAIRLMPDEAPRLTKRKEEAKRNAVRSCLKQARMCILSPTPDIGAAYSWLDKAKLDEDKRIYPDCMKEILLLKLLNLK